ncbi:hypothetical protein [Rouxiella chamberiensis]|uniref:Uncharacterized protein n=1 Tax=Rouxiella chamberiensis TaxID=1513468 RepID=A0ABY7HU16_9GAMM|nr:hypothetical protein [Rouxiella chamberiensis]WAT02917.1 hypothetical protein O1V66_10685 [Rouxiella chamberiensis]
MAFMIMEKPAKVVASYRVVGPYEKSVKEGFAALTPGRKNTGWAKANG